MSLCKKLKFQQISLHNEIYKQPLNDINRELSTFSTGFSTSVKRKSVDNSRANFVYTIFSTVVHNSVECDLIYITTKFQYVIPRKGEALTWESHGIMLRLRPKSISSLRSGHHVASLLAMTFFFCIQYGFTHRLYH